MGLLSFEDNSLWVNGGWFIAAGVVVWLAGTKLSVYADVIAERTGLGRAFIGLLLLATATSLPELATTLTAGMIGNAQLLTGNLLGGIAMQTSILAVMDLLLVRRWPLTYFAPNAKLLTDGVMLIALLVLVVLGMAVDGAFAFWGIGAVPLIIFALFLLMLWNNHARNKAATWEATNLPGHVDQDATGPDDRDRMGGGALPQKQSRYQDVSNRRIYLLFSLGALVILVGGYLLARTGDAIALQTGIGSTLIGAVLVAVGTSLPEISTTAMAIRLGAHGMAISNIFGSNALCVALLFVGDLAYREGPILAATSRSDLFLTGLGTLVTCAYLWGMLERRERTFLGMGIASFVVLLLYVGGLAVLYYAT
ncbi:MAG TPA: hypothetical protein VGR35_04545 [Tepidisphaeraceae bacterium]|nr:hypothetical protein [Tepidisphaeraceae bacterium]